MLERSVAASRGTITTETVRNLIESGIGVTLGTEREGIPVTVFVARIVEYATYKSCRVIAAAGRELKETMEYFTLLTTWAQMNEATEIEAWCRPGMARLLKRYGSWEPRLIILTLDIKRTLQ